MRLSAHVGLPLINSLQGCLNEAVDNVGGKDADWERCKKQLPYLYLREAEDYGLHDWESEQIELVGIVFPSICGKKGLDSINKSKQKQTVRKGVYIVEVFVEVG
jgi:hypothetical protein